jgi:LDH2 family malate/lactate/ureidoglycolate dehydrogenase
LRTFDRGYKSSNLALMVELLAGPHSPQPHPANCHRFTAPSPSPSHPLFAHGLMACVAGPLVGAAHMNKLAAKNWGNLVVAINPAMLGEPAKFYKAAGEVRVALPCRSCQVAAAM